MHAAAAALRSSLSSTRSSRAEPSKARLGEPEVQLSREDLEQLGALRHASALAEGLADFATNFVRCLSSHLDLVDQLLSVVHSIEPDWFGEEVAHREAQQQVWALATGVKATAPRVATVVRRQISSLKELRGCASKVERHFERKRSALQERNHYQQKVESLRAEFERHAQGPGFSKEQLHRLSRNQEKLAYAEADLAEAAEQSRKVAEEQLSRNRRALLSALHGLAQAACCGWLISAGAVVCKALQSASAADPEQEEPEEKQRPGVLVLPDAVAEEDLELPERFDPQRPFGDMPPASSALAEELLEGEETKDELEEPEDAENLMLLSVRELRERLRERGLSSSGLVEKQDLVQRLQMAAAKERRASATEAAGPVEVEPGVRVPKDAEEVASIPRGGTSASSPPSGYATSPSRPARAPSADSDELRAVFG